MTIIHSSAASTGPQRTDSDDLERLITLGTDALEARCRRDAAGGLPRADELWIVRWLSIDFEPAFEALSARCSALAHDDPLHAARLREGLGALRRIRLDLTALAVDPRGVERFPASLDDFVARWHRCVAEVLPARSPRERRTT
jgi:hypothetical protein